MGPDIGTFLGHGRQIDGALPSIYLSSMINLGPEIHFTKFFIAIQIRRIFRFALTPILTKRPLKNFARDATAVLLRQVPKFVANSLPVTDSQQGELSIEFETRVKIVSEIAKPRYHAVYTVSMLCFGNHYSSNCNHPIYLPIFSRIIWKWLSAFFISLYLSITTSIHRNIDIEAALYHFICTAL